MARRLCWLVEPSVKLACAEVPATVEPDGRDFPFARVLRHSADVTTEQGRGFFSREQGLKCRSG